MGGFGGLAEGFGHYFCFTEEYSMVPNVISLYIFLKREVGLGE